MFGLQDEDGTLLQSDLPSIRDGEAEGSGDSKPADAGLGGNKALASFKPLACRL